MNGLDFFAMDAQGGQGGDAGLPAAGAAAPAAPATAGGDAGAAGAGAGGGQPAASGGSAGAGSLLARGAAAAGGGQPAAGSGAGADAAASAAPKIPEKYLVKRDDGTIDHEASALKLAEGYSHLERRLGSGEAPPKSPDEYAPEVPAGVELEKLKADPLYQGFLKGAHARGINNSQLCYILDAWAQRQAPDPAAAEAELRTVWKTDAEMQRGLAMSYRGVQHFAGSQDFAAKLDVKFGNDPDFVRLMASIGGQLGEDRPVEGITAAEADTLESLRASPAYMDGRHPDHARTVAKVNALYAKKYPT